MKRPKRTKLIRTSNKMTMIIWGQYALDIPTNIYCIYHRNAPNK
jgi:hypothetical protein